MSGMNGATVVNCLPYLLKWMGGHWYVLLDRHRCVIGCPLGWKSNMYNGAFLLYSMTPERAAKLSCSGKSDTKEIYLHDGMTEDLLSNPKAWDEYQKRLSYLAKIRVKQWPKPVNISPQRGGEWQRKPWTNINGQVNED